MTAPERTFLPFSGSFKYGPFWWSWPFLGSDLPSPGKWSGTVSLPGKWPALPWELVRDRAPHREVTWAFTSRVWASLPGCGHSLPRCGHTSRIGSYLQFPKEGQNAHPGAVILYTPSPVLEWQGWFTPRNIELCPWRRSFIKASAIKNANIVFALLWANWYFSLDNVPNIKREHFVRDITLGLNDSWEWSC